MANCILNRDLGLLQNIPDAEQRCNIYGQGVKLEGIINASVRKKNSLNVFSHPASQTKETTVIVKPH